MSSVPCKTVVLSWLSCRCSLVPAVLPFCHFLTFLSSVSCPVWSKGSLVPVWCLRLWHHPLPPPFLSVSGCMQWDVWFHCMVGFCWRAGVCSDMQAQTLVSLAISSLALWCSLGKQLPLLGLYFGNLGNVFLGEAVPAFIQSGNNPLHTSINCQVDLSTLTCQAELARLYFPSCPVSSVLPRLCCLGCPNMLVLS